MMLVLILVSLCIFYVFLICPRLHKRNIDVFLQVDYAHRGLWSKDIPENSLPAFAAAADAGYGIELDVQLTKDHQLAVIHDADLFRMCGRQVDIHELTLKEAQKEYLLGTEYTIPSLEDVLRLVDGRVPLIIEVKSCSEIRTLCEKTAELLDHYQGPFCIESFHPLAVRWFRFRRPAWIRGQLAYGLNNRKYHKSPINILLSTLISNAAGRPDFIAFDVETEQCISFQLIRKLFHPWTVGWTVKSSDQLRMLRDRYDLLIFEGFRPNGKPDMKS